MSQSLAQVWLHIVFSTKNRQAFLREPKFRVEVFRILAHYVKDTKCIVATVGGWEDHVHLLVGLSRTKTIADLLEHIKTESSKWAKDAEHGNSLFSWQAGYGAFSVSHSVVPNVVKYIKQQDRHHAEQSYQDEYRRICLRHDVKIDERYVWD